MTTLSIRLPDYLHHSIRDLAKKEGVSINQIITLAIAEKLSALQTEDYLGKRAKKGSERKFRAILGKVQDTEPEESDKV